MSKGLVIVESPTKVKTLQKFLGNDYVIKASVGHIKDLPEGELGVDLEKDFQPSYVPISGKGKIIRELKKASKSVKNIYLGPDPDREGEAIAWHIAKELEPVNDNIHRVLFHEITERGVSDAMASPLRIRSAWPASRVSGLKSRSEMRRETRMARIEPTTPIPSRNLLRSAIVACINNTGPGLNLVGPATTYAVLTDFQTWVCTAAMLLGRLELFTLIVVFTPGFWRQ